MAATTLNTWRLYSRKISPKTCFCSPACLTCWNHFINVGGKEYLNTLMFNGSTNFQILKNIFRDYKGFFLKIKASMVLKSKQKPNEPYPLLQLMFKRTFCKGFFDKISIQCRNYCKDQLTKSMFTFLISNNWFKVVIFTFSQISKKVSSCLRKWLGLPIALDSSSTKLWLPLTFLEEVQMYKVKRHPKVALPGRPLCHQSLAGRVGRHSVGLGLFSGVFFWQRHIQEKVRLQQREVK